MATPPLLAGLRDGTVATPRLQTYVLESGPATGTSVVFVHGNVSNARFFEETLVANDGVRNRPIRHAMS